MKITDYIASRQTKKVPADIRERWQTRIVPRGLEQQGETGTQIYLRDYGKNIAAKKCLAFGQLALEEGFEAFAHGFYKKAAELENVQLEVSGVGNMMITSPAIVAIAKQQFKAEVNTAFPLHAQPGKLVTMQPVDANNFRDAYIADGSFWGQPKIDGQKMLVFATRNEVFYQSRSLKLSGPPSAQMDQDFRATAAATGNFILEGELTFLDINGGEHRTGSQAATINEELGAALAPVQMKYYIFACLFVEGAQMGTYADMVREGSWMASLIQSNDIVAVETAETTYSKRNLAARQQAEGREGEVWFQPNRPYTPGKSGMIVRTKYLTEFDAVVIGFTETTAQGYAFGAMEISSINGKPLGLVGTGFTLYERQQLLEKFRNEGQFSVKIRSQGFTEAGLAWHGRFLEEIE